MKIIVKRAGRFESGRKAIALALKDNKGYYYCWFSEEHSSKNFVLASHLLYEEQKDQIVTQLLKEGHTL